MLELTCQDVDLEVVRVGDLAVLRAVTDALIINIPVTAAGVLFIVGRLAELAA